MNNNKIESWKGYAIAALFLVTKLSEFLLYENGQFLAGKVSVRVRSALIALVYRKALSVSPCALVASSAGDLENFIASDMQRIQDAIHQFHILWLTPLLVCLGCWLLYVHIGWVFLIGLLCIIVILCVSAATSISVQYFSVCLCSVSICMMMMNDI